MRMEGEKTKKGRLYMDKIEAIFLGCIVYFSYILFK